MLTVVVLTVSPGSVALQIKEYPELCTTKDCIIAAAEVLHKLDTTVSPCENFYQFSCGNYIRDTVLSGDAPEISTMALLNVRHKKISF